MTRPLLQTRDACDNLRERLEECPAVRQYGAEEAATLMHAFSDIESSARRFLCDQLPRLADPGTRRESLEDLLAEIQEDFRHILYHVHDPQFFRLVEPTHDWLRLSSECEGEGADH